MMSDVVLPSNNFIDTCIVYSSGCQKLVHTNVQLIDNEKLTISLLVLRRHVTSNQTHSMGLAVNIEKEPKDDRWNDTPEELSGMVLSSAVGIVVGILIMLKFNLERDNHNISYNTTRLECNHAYANK